MIGSTSRRFIEQHPAEVLDVAAATKTATGLLKRIGRSMQVIEKYGERGRNRTFNLLIKSQLGFEAALDASTTIGGL